MRASRSPLVPIAPRASRVRCATLAVALLGALAACSSGSSSPAGGGDASTNDAGSIDGSIADGALDTGIDAAPPNGCSAADFAANDHTPDNDARIIQGPIDATAAQYAPHCMRIKVGQNVTWKSDFTHHPLNVTYVADRDASADASTVVVIGGPDGSNDIETVTPGQTGRLLFACDAHPAVMFGAVEIVP